MEKTPVIPNVSVEVLDDRTILIGISHEPSDRSDEYLVETKRISESDFIKKEGHGTKDLKEAIQNGIREAFRTGSLKMRPFGKNDLYHFLPTDRTELWGMTTHISRYVPVIQYCATLSTIEYALSQSGGPDILYASERYNLKDCKAVTPAPEGMVAMDSDGCPCRVVSLAHFENDVILPVVYCDGDNRMHLLNEPIRIGEINHEGFDIDKSGIYYKYISNFHARFWGTEFINSFGDSYDVFLALLKDYGLEIECTE